MKFYALSCSLSSTTRAKRYEILASLSLTKKKVLGTPRFLPQMSRQSAVVLRTFRNARPQRRAPPPKKKDPRQRLPPCHISTLLTTLLWLACASQKPTLSLHLCCKEPPREMGHMRSEKSSLLFASANLCMIVVPLSKPTTRWPQGPVG